MPILRPLLLPAALAAALVVPSAALATPAFYEAEYDVDVDVTATWAQSKQDIDRGYPKQRFSGKGTATFHGKLTNVLFRNGVLLAEQPVGAVGPPTITGSGETSSVHYDYAGHREYTTRGTCTPNPWAYPSQASMRRAAAQPDATSEQLTVRLTETLPFSLACTDGTLNGGGDLAWSGAAFPGGPMDTTFSLPHEAIGMGKIIQLVNSTAAQGTPGYCPGTDEHTTACTYSWTGKLTFTRTAEYQYDGDPGGVGAGTSGGGATPPPTGTDPRADAISKAVEQYGKDVAASDPRADAITKAVEQYGKDVAASDPRADAISKAIEQYGQELRFTAGCASGCSGTAVVLPGRTGLRAGPGARAAARRPLARLRFTVPAGKPRTIRLRLAPKVRRALRHARGASVALTLRPKAGRPVQRTLPLRSVQR